MLFNSIEFMLFLPIAFIFFWIVPKKCKWLVLLIASYVFYMWWNWKLVFLILFTTIISYVCGILISKYSNKATIKRTVLNCWPPFVFISKFEVELSKCYNAKNPRA